MFTHFLFLNGCLSINEPCHLFSSLANVLWVNVEEGVCVRERTNTKLCQKRQYILYAQTFAPQNIICNKNSNQFSSSNRKNTYKTWMYHHNFKLTTSTNEELAMTSHLHPDGTFILLAALFLMDLQRKPAQFNPDCMATI